MLNYGLQPTKRGLPTGTFKFVSANYGEVETQNFVFELELRYHPPHIFAFLLPEAFRYYATMQYGGYTYPGNMHVVKI